MSYIAVWVEEALHETRRPRDTFETTICRGKKIMVQTCIVGCMNFSHPDSLISFQFIPAVIIYHGSRMEVLFAKGRATWLAKINRKDWIPTKSSVFCWMHFVMVSILIRS